MNAAAGDGQRRVCAGGANHRFAGDIVTLDGRFHRGAWLARQVKASHRRGGGYGEELKEENRRYYGSIVNFAGRGEQIPNDKCYTELDPNVVDQWGIPVLLFHWKWAEAELLQAQVAYLAALLRYARAADETEDPQARLAWLYRRTPWADDRYLLYPVFVER